MTSIPYETPSLPTLLTVSSFIYLINVAEALFNHLLHAGLIGPLVLGVIYGPQAADILSSYVQSTFIILGYIGLLLLVFEAGLSTDISLLFDNILLSAVVALTGVLLPIAFSLFLLHFGFEYSPLQAFAAGASLCSTSLGTTLSLLDGKTKKTRTGAVLMSAALLDDVVGLVIAAIITQLSSTGDAPASISWQTIVRPILVSIAFAFAAPFLAYTVYVLKAAAPAPLRARTHFLERGRSQMFVMVAALSGAAAGAQYAGTSELFGAYLAGAVVTHAFSPLTPTSTPPARSRPRSSSPPRATPQTTFDAHLRPLLQTFLAPVFFASIGTALPIRSLGAVGGSHRVVWRGALYALLMVLAKAVVGLWILVWPDAARGWCGRRRRPRRVARERDGGAAPPDASPALQLRADADADDARAPAAFGRARSAALLGLAMVARGEIALIVAQLARPLLLGDAASSEPFAVVIWAILVTTVGGAVGVGMLLKMPG